MSGGERIVYTEIPKKKHFLVDILDFEILSLNLNIGVEYTPPPLAWLTVNFPLHIIVKTLKHKPTYLLGLKVEDVLKIASLKKVACPPVWGQQKLPQWLSRRLSPPVEAAWGPGGT